MTSRPLLPTNAAGLGDNQKHPPHESTGRQPPGPSKPTYAKRGKITIVACVPCRRRKTKCDGKRPACSQCIAREGQCVYDMTDEQRRLTFLRDNVEQLVEEKSALESLIWSLQTGSPENALEMRRRLRAGEDIAVLAHETHAARTATEGNQERSLSSAGQSSTGEESSTQERGRPKAMIEEYESLIKTMAEAPPLELEEILRRLRLNETVPSVLSSISGGTLLQPLNPQPEPVIPNLEQAYSSQGSTFGMVKGTGPYREVHSQAPNAHTPLSNQPWTSVTDDLDFVNHLLDLYFAWQHSFFQSFPETLFREDMAAGRTKYCSRLLVNAICAAGCLLSKHPQSRRDPMDSRTAGLDFFDEAVRLLNETQTSSLPTMAALFLLCHIEGNRGRLSALWLYCGRSSRMALDLNLHLRNDNHDSDDEQARREQDARTHAFWGCFISDQVTSFTLGRLPQFQTSAITVGLPTISVDFDDEKWMAYDTPGPNKPSARSTTFNRVAALSKIVNSTLQMFFAPSRVLSGTLLLDEYTKYLSWYRTLPDIVATVDDAPPHVLCLHMYYHAAVLLLFRPFLKATFTESDVSPREACRAAANAISDIFAQHRRMYGLVGIYTFQVHCLLTACTIHVINLPAIASTTYLTAACNSFRELIPQCEWAAGCLNILKGLVQKWNIILPLEAETALYKNAAMLEGRGFATPPVDSQAEEGAEHGAQSASLSTQPRSPSYETTFSPFALDQPGGAPQKRPHYPLPSSQIMQKRQRLQPRPSNQKRPSDQQQPTDYLFAPFPNQPAPLMAPIHTSEGVTKRGSADQTGKGKAKAEGDVRASGSNQGRDGDGDGDGGLLAGVFDGLNFEGDGMFDPFMGYTGEGSGWSGMPSDRA